MSEMLHCMKWLGILAPVVLLAGCSITRPEQENFILLTGSAGVQPFVTTLARKLNLSTHSQTVDVGGANGRMMIELEGTQIVVGLSSMPEGRCDINAPMPSRYRADEFRLDLVYENPRLLWAKRASVAERVVAKKAIIETAKEHGQTLVPFEEC